MEDLRQKSKIRSSRKKDHVEHVLKNKFEGNTHFNDIYLEHNSLPEIDFNDIDTKINFLDKNINFPIMINAMTGGFDRAVEINSNLAKIAKNLNIPMAVGSQTIAIKDKEYEKSFKIVREMLDDGVVISNVNAFVNVDEAKKAIDMINSDALQIHLNPAQEICMPEGDRNFKGVLRNIENIVKVLDKPVIIKEVGFGISKNVVNSLYDIGVRYIDLGGHGGTNFIKIENARNSNFEFDELFEWGIPTALSLLETKDLKKDLNIVCSGGMRTANDVIKALSIGANMIGVSGPILRELEEKGYESAYKYIENIIYKSKVIMLLLGKKNINELRTVPYRIKGELKELLDGKNE